MYPYQRTPMGNPYISPITRGYLWVSYPQESLENTINTMVVHARERGTRTICPLKVLTHKGPCSWMPSTHHSQENLGEIHLSNEKTLAIYCTKGIILPIIWGL